MYKSFIILIVFVGALLSSCASNRVIESARNSIIELERINSEQESRNSELESLLNSEREGNRAIKKILEDKQSKLNGYIESERNRIAKERAILGRLEIIFSEESEIIDKLIKGYNEIRKYIEALEVLE